MPPFLWAACARRGRAGRAAGGGGPPGGGSGVS